MAKMTEVHRAESGGKLCFPSAGQRALHSAFPCLIAQFFCEVGVVTAVSQAGKLNYKAGYVLSHTTGSPLVMFHELTRIVNGEVTYTVWVTLSRRPCGRSHTWPFHRKEVKWFAQSHGVSERY